MEDSAAQTTETTVDNSSSVDVLDSYDLSKPDGGLGTTSDNDNDSQESQHDDDDRSADSVEQQTGIESEDDAKGASDNPDNMSEAERNNYFAQRRIAAKQQAAQADSQLLKELSNQAINDFINVEPDEQDFEDMDPAVADQLRELRRNERARQAEQALMQVKQTREQTRLSVMQAESSIPLFNPSDPHYNQFLHEEALSEWAHRYAIVAEDANGNPQIVGTHEGAPSPLEYLQTKAPQYEAMIKAERSRGQRSAQRNRANSSGSGSASRSTGSADRMSDLEARIGDVPLTDV